MTLYSNKLIKFKNYVAASVIIIILFSASLVENQNDQSMDILRDNAAYAQIGCRSMQDMINGKRMLESKGIKSYMEVRTRAATIVGLPFNPFSVCFIEPTPHMRLKKRMNENCGPINFYRKIKAEKEWDKKEKSDDDEEEIDMVMVQEKQIKKEETLTYHTLASNLPYKKVEGKETVCYISSHIQESIDMFKPNWKDLIHLSFVGFDAQGKKFHCTKREIKVQGIMDRGYYDYIFDIYLPLSYLHEIQLEKLSEASYILQVPMKSEKKYMKVKKLIKDYYLEKHLMLKRWHSGSRSYTMLRKQYLLAWSVIWAVIVHLLIETLLFSFLFICYKVKDLGILQSLGYTTKRLSRIMFLHTLKQSLMIISTGTLLVSSIFYFFGVQIGEYFGMPREVQVRWDVLGMVSIGYIGLTLLSQWIIMEYVKRQDIAKNIYGKEGRNQEKDKGTIEVKDTPNAVEFEGSKNYNGSQIFEDAEIKIKKGEFVAVMSKTGGGKSTFARMFSALEKPREGKVVFSRDIMGDTNNVELMQQRIGFVFQQFKLLPLTVRENLLLVTDEENTKRLLTEVELEDKIDSLPQKLSGGQQQRVAIARAFAKDPAIIIADEPTANLDEETAQKVFSMLTSACREKGVTLIVFTHNSAHAKQADTLYRIEEKKIVKV